MTEEEFDKIIDIIDDLRFEAYYILDDSGIPVLSQETVNKLRNLCGLAPE
jgi:hypothetical protein